MSVSLIFGIVLLSFLVVINTIYVIFIIIEHYKTNKEIEEYKKFCAFLSEKNNISWHKKVDYKNLNQSIDYLTYNSKLYEESRKLTQQEFDKLKKEYIFYIYPNVRFSIKKG